MPQNSIAACPNGIEKAKQALKRKGLSRQKLAGYKDCNLSRSTIDNFFKGKAVNSDSFVNICEVLELDFDEIAGISQISERSAPRNESLTETINIDELVQTVRDKISPYIEERCNTMRVLDMAQPIGLDDIYTSVNILEKISGRRRVSSVEELTKNVSVENFERFSLGGVKEERVPGLEAITKCSKLMILGKPGAGKTTFLKHLALKCMKGGFEENRIPLFFTLKDFAEAPNQPNLFSYLIEIFVKYNITTNTDAGINSIEQLLKQGKLLVLLDGLDEVRETNNARILKQIQYFTNDYSKNQFVITCRIASREYTFQQFTEVEIADFNLEQIKSFSEKWFTAKNDTIKADKFVEKLQDDISIGELATNPLLLTLLCLVFEESAEFPKNRSELYKEGLDVLLKKWDSKRNIEREQIYKKLSLKRKEDLLSQVAYSTFEQEQYFFKQKYIVARITEYICNLPDCSDDPEVLQLDSEAVLKSIEAQHGLFVERARGIYSFSHLTFHEYFTARKIKEAGNDKLLHTLAAHITETRWREVFLLTVGMLDNANLLLQFMKQQIDNLLADDEKLQQFLAWVEEKSNSVKAPYKKAAVRAFYFVLALYLDRDFDEDRYEFLDSDLHLALDQDLDKDKYQFLYSNHHLSLNEDLIESFDEYLALAIHVALIRDKRLELSLEKCGSYQDHDINEDQEIVCIIDFVINSHCKDELKQKLQQLKNQLPDPTEPLDVFDYSWFLEEANWTEQLKAIMVEHRNIGQSWQFNRSQKGLLREYYRANKFLIECVNSDCYVSRNVRKYIEDTLLLPVKSIPPARLE